MLSGIWEDDDNQETFPMFDSAEAAFRQGKGSGRAPELFLSFILSKSLNLAVPQFALPIKWG